VPLSPAIIVDRVPAHELATGAVLRALDPTEHNMERLNAHARGAGRAYLALVVEGPLSRASLEQAIDALTTRHPLLRVRIVRGDDGACHFAPTRGDREDGTARVPLSYTAAEELSTWPELLEADMNGGAIASDKGPLFAFAVIEPPGLDDGASSRRVVVLAGHHATADGMSLLTLLRELLEQLAHPHAPVRLEDRALVDPFSLDLPVPELSELEAKLRALLDERSARRREELETLRERLELLERDLLMERGADGRFPAALKTVHGWLSSLDAELLPARGIVAEADCGTGAARYERARTALLHRALGVEPTRALRRLAKEHGLTLHGVLAAAVLLALAAEPAGPGRLALASAVSLRQKLVPPLSSHDVKMAIDIVVSRISVEAGTRFWELARRAGDDVTRAMGNARPLSSYFRTVRRDFGDIPPGVPLPLLTNFGKVELAAEYGRLKVLELCGAMTTHGSFQLVVLALTFDERLSMSFYCETPTVSRAALERFAGRVLANLDRVAAGGEPSVFKSA
jgi:hypothetical protein